MNIPVNSTAPRKKRSKLARVSVSVLVFLLLIGVGEIALRQIVPTKIGDGIRDALHLSSDHPVDVSVTGLLLPQLVTGRFNRVAVAADDVPLGDSGIRADVSGIATDLPRDIEHEELGETRLTAVLSEDQLQTALATLSRGMEFDLDISRNQLTIATSLNLFGQGIPVTVRLIPSLNDEGLHIEPIGVDAAGLISLDVDELPNFQILAPIADGLDLCLDDMVPKGVHLDDLSLSTTRTLRVSATLDPSIMLDSELQQVGECDTRSAQIP